MDKQAAKILLASYRPQDADDPDFAEALRQVAADPELAAWFEESQRFDAVMSAKLREVRVPADVKSQLLLGAGAASRADTAPRSRIWALAGAIAALLVLGLLSLRFLTPRQRPLSPLEAQAISYTNEMPALQFVCFNADAVAQWVNEQPGARKVGLKLSAPGPGMSMAVIGSSVVEWQGHPVVMVCLQDGKRMAMLYILKAGDAAELQDGPGGTVQRAGWVVRTTKSEGQVRLLTAKGRPEELDFPTLY